MFLAGASEQESLERFIGEGMCHLVGGGINDPSPSHLAPLARDESRTSDQKASWVAALQSPCFPHFMTPELSLDHFRVPGIEIETFHTEKYCIYELEIENLPQKVRKTFVEAYILFG